MSSIEVGEKIVLSNGLQGIISHVSPETERVCEYMTGDSYPIGIYEYKEITIILTDGRSYRTRVRTGSDYSYINYTWRYGVI